MIWQYVDGIVIKDLRGFTGEKLQLNVGDR